MNPRKKQLLEQAETLLAELKMLSEKADGLTTEELARAEAIQGELKSIRTEIEALNAQEALKGSFTSYQSWLNDPSLKAKVTGLEYAGETLIDERKGVVESTGYGLIAQSKYKNLVTKEYKEAFGGYILRGERNLSNDNMKALQEGIDDQGGYFVPPDWTLDIIRREPTPLVISSLVRRWQTARDAKIFPKVRYTGNADDDANAVLYSTGVRVTYPGEIPDADTTIDTTDPATGELRIDVYTAMLSSSITNDMLEDAAVDVEAFLREIYQETVDLEQDYRILRGTGVGQASGILKNPSSSATGDEPQYIVSGVADALTADGILDLAFGLAPQYLRNARFIMNWLSTAKAITKLKDGEGNYLWSMGSQDNRLARPILNRDLLGFPPAYSEFMPAVAANAYPIIFGDPMGYYLVQRIGFSIQVLRETKAKRNQIELVGRLRFGGKVAKPWAMKVQKVAT
ncbi:MAG: hypothetical protein A2W00_04695 [Candidatus Eisenbacteria bacterium RBG_16_71_46]|nr:MAG: hypothetical protein A2W00_04695 [Candidatus Eisenbacteria bacterium RBG_16_71_46]